jgi:hypothetical protein
MNYIAAELDFYPLSNSDDVVLTYSFQRDDWNSDALLKVTVANDIINAFNNKYNTALELFNETDSITVDDLTRKCYSDLRRMQDLNKTDRGSVAILYCTNFDNSNLLDRWSTQSYNIILKRMEDDRRQHELEDASAPKIKNIIENTEQEIELNESEY